MQSKCCQINFKSQIFNLYWNMCYTESHQPVKNLICDYVEKNL